MSFLRLIFLWILVISPCTAGGQLMGALNIFGSTKGIPPKLLEAIALVESGQRSGSASTPWPWTINVSGKGYTYASKAEAIKAVRSFQGRGFDSIDVGIMQINLKHHPHAFANLEDAFDPKKNIAYAAKFLLRLYLKHGAWHTAVKHYHSGNPTLGNNYLQKVLKAWSKTKLDSFGFGPINLVHTRPSDEKDLPEPKSFKSTVQTKEQKNIPISVSFAPIKLMGSTPQKIQKKGSDSPQKNNPGAISGGGIFPLTVQYQKPMKRKSQREKSTPLILVATDVMPLH